MEMEVQLFESIEDISRSFGFVNADLINGFLNDVRSIFRQIIELIDRFWEKVSSLTHQNPIEGSSTVEEALWKKQREIIDAREFKLQERARKWAKDLQRTFQE